MREDTIYDALLSAIHADEDGYVDMPEFELPALNATKAELKRAFVYLQVNGYIRFVKHFAGLDRLGFEAIYAGGYSAFKQKQRQRDEFDQSVGRAAINANRLSLTSIISNSVLGLIAILVSIYAAVQVGKAEENIAKSDHNLMMTDVAMREVQAEQERINEIVNTATMLQDSLRMHLDWLRKTTNYHFNDTPPRSAKSTRKTPQPTVDERFKNAASSEKQ